MADYGKDQLYENPEYATALGEKRHNDRWSDLSEYARRRALRRSQTFARRLRAISTTDLSRQEALSADLLMSSLRENQESVPFKEWEMPVNQVHGIHCELPQLVAVTPFADKRDYEDYLARLRRVPLLFSQLTEDMRQGIRDKRVQPSVVSEKVLAQVEAILSIDGDQRPFVAPVKQFPSTMPAEVRASIAAAVSRSLAHDVIPAYQRLALFIRTEYIPHGRPEPGIWALSDGTAYYAFCIRRNTTLPMSAD